MINIKKTIETIYTIHIIEKKIIKINKLIYYKLNKNYKYLKNKLLNKLYKILKSIKKIKKKVLKIKLKNINKNNYYNNLIDKYKKQILNIKNNIELIIIKKEIKYFKIKIKINNKKNNKINKKLNIFKKIKKIIKKKIKNNIIFLIYYKKKNSYLKKKLKIIKYKLKLILNFILNKKKVKKLEIYKIYCNIKKNSKDKKGIISVDYNRIVNNVYLIIPIQKYLDLLNYEYINYDIYTGNILIDTYLANKIKNKINNFIKKIIK
ncbi:hypothetical protein [Candidatus Shikimatogenerans bostrichidophilus]|uniref:hypothetical protein n=1 Tax=Candidatus Shikimatogenerans bostrichidophilus TaxID=2943807 RepID=UPI00296652E8